MLKITGEIVIAQEGGYILQKDDDTYINLYGEQINVEEGMKLAIWIPNNLKSHKTLQAAQHAYCDGIKLIAEIGTYPIIHNIDE